MPALQHSTRPGSREPVIQWFVAGDEGVPEARRRHVSSPRQGCRIPGPEGGRQRLEFLPIHTVHEYTKDFHRGPGSDLRHTLRQRRNGHGGSGWTEPESDGQGREKSEGNAQALCPARGPSKNGCGACHGPGCGGADSLARNHGPQGTHDQEQRRGSGGERGLEETEAQGKYGQNREDLLEDSGSESSPAEADQKGQDPEQDEQ